MFVKVVCKPKTEFNPDLVEAIPRETLYHCDKVDVLDIPLSNAVRFVMTKGEGIQTIQVSKEGRAVYAMNDDGKTIDTFIWADW